MSNNKIPTTELSDEDDEISLPETPKPKKPEDFNLLYDEALTKIAKSFNRLAKSLKPSDIKKMSGKDKVNAISKLAFIANSAKGQIKPKKSFFDGYNLDKMSVQELEQLEQDYIASTYNQAN